MTRRRRALAATLAFLIGGVATASTAVAAPPSIDSVLADDCARGTFAYSPEPPPALLALQTNLAWKYATGLNVIVAVVDSGIDASNEHLRDAVIGGVNLVDDGENASGLSDLDGHGTAIAGEIAARQISDSGVVGLAPRAMLLSVRIFRGRDPQTIDAGFGPTSERLVAGIRYAVDHGASIINVSLSEYTESSALLDVVNYATSRGSLIIASAGNVKTTENTSNTPRYPAGYPGVIGVAAVDSLGLVQDSISGPHVSVAAPGTNVLTSATGAGDCIYSTDEASTSYATGYVSGAAALVAEAHPDETPAQWKYRLEATAVRVNLDERTDAAGWGIIQPRDAIVLVPSASTRGPESPFTDTAGSAVSTTDVVVTATPSHSALGLTREVMMYVLIAAISVLGVLGVLIVLRRIRRAARVD